MVAHFGTRLRKGAMTTAVAAVAVAALSASQAPGATTDDAGRQTTGADAESTPDANSDGSATGNSPYYTDLPPLNTPSPAPTIGTPVSVGEAEAGIPATVLAAYKQAAASLRASKAGCNLPWELLAAIGKVESGQARGGNVDAQGNTITAILGPVLNGEGFANIGDTDGGAYDGDSTYDRAVGPMQFIPSTWEWAGRDGNGDGKKDPNNIYDAALAAGGYLCRFNWDLADEADLHTAILSYNNSTEYLNTVLSWLEFYREGTHEVPDGTGTLPSNRSDSSDGVTTTPSATPTTPNTPSPNTPSPSTPPKGDSSPGTKPTLPATPIPSPTPTETVDHLEDAGTGTLTATAGDAFGERVAVRTETSAGKAVAKVRVRFTIVGDATDATFTGGERVATVVTDSKGTATAPALVAGEKTGSFVVRTSVVGRTLTGLDFTANVTARQADALARTTTTALTCVPGGAFAEAVEVKATLNGAVADKVAATATLITSADDATVNDKGPYFKDAAGNPVRTLTDLTTDADGLLKLPALFADDTTGTFLLRVTTTGGATLTVELTVAAATTPEPTPSTTSEPTASATP
ncbi:lytic transglycosylase domain-containing protein [Streptomyces sp. NPDC088747]|uniref:lytic transglycosylase domain-containing protein n=1 Tax=Streptomyces sp. NPDC088747 TaxID=3365886 RepID=UPI003816C446